MRLVVRPRADTERQLAGMSAYLGGTRVNPWAARDQASAPPIHPSGSDLGLHPEHPSFGGLPAAETYLNGRSGRDPGRYGSASQSGEETAPPPRDRLRHTPAERDQRPQPLNPFPRTSRHGGAPGAGQGARLARRHRPQHGRVGQAGSAGVQARRAARACRSAAGAGRCRRGAAVADPRLRVQHRAAVRRRASTGLRVSDRSSGVLVGEPPTRSSRSTRAAGSTGSAPR